MLGSGMGNMVSAAALAATAMNSNVIAITVRLNKTTVPPIPLILLVCA